MATKAVPTHAKAFANISGVATIVLHLVTSFVKWSIHIWRDVIDSSCHRPNDIPSCDRYDKINTSCSGSDITL